MRVVHVPPPNPIEAKRRDAERDASTLEVALRAQRGKALTPSDASALSGLPIDAAEAGLLVLARRFPATLEVGPTGVLVFRFDSLRRARGPSALALWWSAVRARVLEPLIAALTLAVGPVLLANLARDIAALGAVAMDQGWFWLAMLPCMVFGVAAGLGALLSFLMFIVLPVTGALMMVGGGVMIYAAFAEGKEGGGIAAMVLFGAFMIWFGWNLAKWGFKLWLDNVFKKATWARTLWTDAIQFLLGPPRPAPDPLADERRLVRLIREREGVLALSDLVGLFGWTPAEADTQIARILCDYGGDVVVTDDGAVLYAFRDPRAQSGATFAGSLLATAGAVSTDAPDSPAPPPRFFPGGGFWFVFAGLAWGCLGVLLDPGLPLFPDADGLVPKIAGEGKNEIRFFGLGLWPYLVIFGPLALRAPLHVARLVRARRRRRLAPYLAIAANTPEGAPLSAPDLRLVAELGGDYDGARLSFPELARALAAARAVRADPTALERATVP